MEFLRVFDQNVRFGVGTAVVNGVETWNCALDSSMVRSNKSMNSARTSMMLE